MSNEFDWYGDDDIAVRHQPAIAVYTNVHGNVTIRQRGEIDPRTLEYDDTVIVVTPGNAAELAHAILALAPPAPGPTLALPAPSPSDPTAAERQRRHRARKRHGPCDRDAVTANRDGNGSDLFPD